MIVLLIVRSFKSCSKSHLVQEYIGKVDELIKEKNEAMNEVMAKENEEEDIIKQQLATGEGDSDIGKLETVLVMEMAIEVVMILTSMTLMTLYISLAIRC